jgi:hypothetical protein
MDADDGDAGHELTDCLLALERDLLRPEIRRSRVELEARLAPDFVELGGSGRAYDRPAVIAALGDEEPGSVRIEDFAVRLLAPEVALATYRSVRTAPGGGAAAVALRTSIWRREGEAWQMTFHQGTPCT